MFPIRFGWAHGVRSGLRKRRVLSGHAPVCEGKRGHQLKSVIMLRSCRCTHLIVMCCWLPRTSIHLVGVALSFYLACSFRAVLCAPRFLFSLLVSCLTPIPPSLPPSLPPPLLPYPSPCLAAAKKILGSRGRSRKSSKRRTKRRKPPPPPPID